MQYNAWNLDICAWSVVADLFSLVLLKPVSIAVCRIKLSANYIRLRSSSDCWYQYSVTYTPNIDSHGLRYKLLYTHSDVIGPARAFDGSILFLPRELSSKVRSSKVTIWLAVKARAENWMRYCDPLLPVTHPSHDSVEQTCAASHLFNFYKFCFQFCIVFCFYDIIIIIFEPYAVCRWPHYSVQILRLVLRWLLKSLWSRPSRCHPENAYRCITYYLRGTQVTKSIPSNIIYFYNTYICARHTPVGVRSRVSMCPVIERIGPRSSVQERLWNPSVV